MVNLFEVNVNPCNNYIFGMLLLLIMYGLKK